MSNFRHTNRNLNRFWQITPGMRAITMHMCALQESHSFEKDNAPVCWGWGKVLCVGLDCHSHKLEIGWPLHGSFFTSLLKFFSRK